MSANLILTNGRFYTLDPQNSFATAVAIHDDKIIAVGDDDAIAELLGPHGEHIDLQGAAVTPGLVDAHVHFQMYSLTLLQVEAYEVPSLEIMQQRVADYVGRHPAGTWIQGHGWKSQLWPDPQMPTAADLDKVAPEHPALLRDKSGHVGWANTLALQLAGVDKNTPDPAGGEIQRDENGQPTGILFETAIELVRTHIPPYTDEQLLTAMRQAQQNCWAVGLTGIHDFDGPDCFAALQTLHRQGELGLRVYKNIPAALIDHAIALGLQTDFGDDWLRIGGIKIFADGALGGNTALMVEPYEGSPNNYGIVVTDKEEMMEIASKASQHGLSVTVHAIGDKAIHDILDVYEAVRAQEPNRRLRHRIEHVQVYHPMDKNRLAELDIVASMQPVHAASDMVMADMYWGERARYSYAWRDMLDSGALLVFGSDFPVEKIDPLLGIYAAVTRRPLSGSYAPDGWYPEQKLTMVETIRAFTEAAAVTSGQSDKLGTITIGKLADLTIFDRDLFNIEPEEIRQTKVIGTIVGGKFKYRHELL